MVAATPALGKMAGIASALCGFHTCRPMLTSKSAPWAASLLIALAAAAALLALGRSPICTCGAVDLWVAGRDSPRTSQMLSDWYSLSHVAHGILLYGALWLLARRWPVEWRFAAALLIEAAWEVTENTPLIIDRYREATAALGYNGDSVLNSMSDMAMMALGFLAARKLPPWLTVVLLILIELAPLAAIRDNLTLNIWMLLAPNEAIAQWQAGA